MRPKATSCSDDQVKTNEFNEAEEEEEVTPIGQATAEKIGKT